ncbi:hypothetical protein EON83_01335 [bacterium]|nr:MAG: hypothetical protein EON83_01335 [bacterium]
MNKCPSWQWPTDDISGIDVEEFSRSFEGRPTQWQVVAFPCLGETINYIWLRSDWNKDLFCICDSAGNSAQVNQLVAVEGWQLRTMGIDALNRAKIGRLYFLDQEGQLRRYGEVARAAIVIRADGRGIWKRWIDDEDVDWTQVKAPFRLFDETSLKEFTSHSALYIWWLLEEALGDPNSDASFARDWVSKSDDEREDLLWNWSRAERERLRAQFQALLLCALLSDDTIWEEEGSWQCSVSSASEILLSPEPEAELRDVPDWLSKAIELLWNGMAPFNEDVLRHECVRQWKQGKSEWASGYSPTWDTFFVETREPTAHERMEAMMRWRDWVEAK